MHHSIIVLSKKSLFSNAPLRGIMLIVLCLLLGAGGIFAQKKSTLAQKLNPEAIEKLHLHEDTLAVLAFAVVNDSIEKERFAACRVLITALVRALKVENSFKYPFERLKSVSIVVPPDSSFRIFTWQLFVNDSTYRYYGAIQMNSSNLQMFPLIDRSAEMRGNLSRETFTPDRWYGALYYNLRQFNTKNGRQYMLFGYDAFEFFEKRKVVEILTFDPAGKPVFGAAPFITRPTVKGGPEHRLILQYSADSKVRCNWDEQYKMVVFDHLIPFPSPFNRDLTYVPDGSYEAIVWEKGRWKYKEKAFNDVQTEAPRPEPVLDGQKGRDIMGKTKN